MGMYTGLRVDIKLKEEFVPIIEDLMELHNWTKVAEKYPKCGPIVNFSQDHRSDFIPFGAILYVPWYRDDPRWDDRLDEKRWVFQCSLKNYHRTIEKFLSNVLPEIAEQVNEVWTQYEEEKEPTRHLNLLS